MWQVGIVPHLRLVAFWPPMGFFERRWLDHADEDAFVRSARSVCELYTASVSAGEIAARHSEVRLFCRLDEGRSDVQVTAHIEPDQGFESGEAVIPPGIADLPAAARARLVLEVLHAATSRLAQARGWDQGALDRAYADTRAAGLRFRWTGPPKISPDRRNVSRPLFVLHDDGHGRVVIEVRRRADDQVVAVSATARAFSTAAGFKRSARTLRWRDKSTIELGELDCPRGTLRLDLTNPGVPGTAEPAPPGPSDAMVLAAIIVQTP